MIKLDDALLAELGLADLSTSHRRALLQIIYEELQSRVGMRLASAMNSLQLSRFDVFIETNDEAAALAFLQTEFPTYPEVVVAEFEVLRAEITVHLQDIRTLCSAYADVPIELPPLKSPWRQPQLREPSTAKLPENRKVK